MSILVVCIAIPAGLVVFGGLVLFFIRLSQKIYKPFKSPHKYDYMYKNPRK